MRRCGAERTPLGLVPQVTGDEYECNSIFAASTIIISWSLFIAATASVALKLSLAYQTFWDMCRHLQGMIRFSKTDTIPH